MVKIKLTFTLLLISASYAFSQEWNTIPVLHGFGGDDYISFIESDKESNNLVLGNNSRFYHMSLVGVYKQYDDSDFSGSNTSFPEVKILNNKITCLKASYGVYEINPITDEIIELYASLPVMHLYLNEDTTWVLLQSDLIKIDGSNVSSFGLSLDEMVKMDNRICGYKDGPWGFATKLNGMHTGFDTSNSTLLDDYVLDIDENKVLSHVYVATNKGISVFNVSNNSFQYHYTPALFPEMEYENVRKVLWDDKNNMLWMVLADENDVIKKISGTNGTWMHFDNSNAPFAMEDFNDMAVDSLGNIWIASDGDVHVLGLDSLKGWLGVEELETEKIDFSVYPNPSAENFYLTSSESGVFDISAYDVNGRIVFSEAGIYIKSGDELIIESKDWLKGAYFIEMKSSDDNLRTEKVIKW